MAGESRAIQQLIDAGALPAGTSNDPNPTVVTTTTTEGAAAAATTDNAGAAPATVDATTAASTTANDTAVASDAAPAGVDATTTTTTSGADTPGAAATTAAAPVIDDAAMLAYLKGKGIEVASLDELKKPAAEPSAEDKEKADQTRKAAVLQFGLENQLFTPSQLESYQADKARDPRAIALNNFSNTILSSDPTLAEMMKTDPAAARQEVESRFAETYGENEQEGSWRRQLGEQEIQRIASNHIQSQYGNIIGAEDTFTKNLELRQAATGYKGIVEEVFTELPKQIKFEVEGQEFTYNIPDNNRNAVREEFLKTETFDRFHKSGMVDKKVLADSANVALMKMEMQGAVTEVAKAYHAAKADTIAKGRLNVPVGADQGGTALGTAIDKPDSPAIAQLKAEMAKQK